MKMNKSFAVFYGEIVEAAKAAADGKPITIGIIVETDSKEFAEWMQTRMNPFFMVSRLNDSQRELSLEDALDARDKAIKRYEDDFRLVHQGVFEHSDVGHSSFCSETGTSAVFYDICERNGVVMLATSLGRKIARLTVVISGEGAKDTCKPQRCVNACIRGFLSKNGLGTMTGESEFPNSVNAG